MNEITQEVTQINLDEILALLSTTNELLTRMLVIAIFAIILFIALRIIRS